MPLRRDDPARRAAGPLPGHHRRRPGPALEVTLRAPGHAQSLSVAAGYGDETTVSPALKPPPAARLGEVCITSRGAAPVSVTATREARTQSRPVGRIDGTPVDGDTYLAFCVGAMGSPLSQAGAIVERMGAFRLGSAARGCCGRCSSWSSWAPLTVLVVG